MSLLSSLKLLCSRFGIHWITAGCGLLVWCGIYVAAICFSYSVIEHDLTEKVSRMLTVRGFNRITVEANGRDMVLNGEVSSEFASELAIEYTYTAWGVRNVTTDLAFKPLGLPHVVITRTLSGDLRVTGEMPAQQHIEHLAEIIPSFINNKTFHHSMLANPETADPTWLELLPEVLQESDDLEGLELEIGAGQIALGGLIESEPDYRIFWQRIESFLGESKINIINRVGIKPSVSTNQESVEP